MPAIAYLPHSPSRISLRRTRHETTEAEAGDVNSFIPPSHQDSKVLSRQQGISLCGDILGSSRDFKIRDWYAVPHPHILISRSILSHTLQSPFPHTCLSLALSRWEIFTRDSLTDLQIHFRVSCHLRHLGNKTSHCLSLSFNYLSRRSLIF